MHALTHTTLYIFFPQKIEEEGILPKSSDDVSFSDNKTKVFTRKVSYSVTFFMNTDVKICSNKYCTKRIMHHAQVGFIPEI